MNDAYERRKAALMQRLQAASGLPSGLRKRTASNLFRYQGRRTRGRLDLGDFNHCLHLDARHRTLDVEGLTTFEQIVDYTLPQGLVPLVTPELKHITIGGATVGIGIESSCFRHGFVHDMLKEAEVLLPDGRVVLCTPDNAHGDLFRGLPNSYGTLGYILRAKIRLMPAARYVHLATTRFERLEAFLEAMRVATERPGVDYIEGIFYDERRLYLTLSRFIEDPPRVHDILRDHIFYKLIQQEKDVYLTTKDYLFRYDPDWFWNLPETGIYRLFRRLAPARFRNSGFYGRYTRLKNALKARLPWTPADEEEPLIQDWEVPWPEAEALTRFALREVELDGRPWIATPIRTPASPTLYPIRAGMLYYNLGCYCQVKKRPDKGDYWYTRIMDAECFARGGIKMLYSSSYLDEETFWKHYNKPAYDTLKSRYDPQGRLPDLYRKCVRGE